jgi:uncharacterized membrane protein
MPAGEERHSPIVDAIAGSEEGTTGEIRVHLSRRIIERDPFARAARLFRRYGISRTAQRNGVLIYVNLRRHRFALVGDEGFHAAVGQPFWEKLARELSENLRATHPERAIAIAVIRVGQRLNKHFPKEPT